MLKNLSADHIYIVCGHTDMRKSIDGLAAIIQQQYQLDLFSNSAFLFCGRRRNRMKVLLWEDSGFLLLIARPGEFAVFDHHARSSSGEQYNDNDSLLGERKYPIKPQHNGCVENYLLKKKDGTESEISVPFIVI